VDFAADPLATRNATKIILRTAQDRLRPSLDSTCRPHSAPLPRPRRPLSHHVLSGCSIPGTGKTPDRFDVIGAAITMSGVVVIIFGRRMFA
jgi:hypothetical protein